MGLLFKATSAARASPTSLASAVGMTGDFSLTWPVMRPGRPARTSDGAAAR
jgi:hypothetical protein